MDIKIVVLFLLLFCASCMAQEKTNDICEDRAVVTIIKRAGRDYCITLTTSDLKEYRLEIEKHAQLYRMYKKNEVHMIRFRGQVVKIDEDGHTWIEVNSFSVFRKNKG